MAHHISIYYPIIKKLLVLLILFLNSFIVNSQHEIFNEIPDSLRKYSYKEYTNFYNNVKVSHVKQAIYLNSHLLKAKQENDKIEKARASIRLFKYLSFKEKQKMADSIIKYGVELKNLGYQSDGYIFKGHLSASEKALKKALYFYSKAKDLALAINDYYRLNIIRYRIGLIYNSLGQYDEGLKLFKQYHKYITSRFEKDSFYQSSYIRSLHLISDSFNKNLKLDSAKVYIDIGLDFSYKVKDLNYYNTFLLSFGINSYSRGEYKIATDSLLKSVYFFEKEKATYRLLANYSYLGKSYHKLDIEKALLWYNKMDSLVEITGHSDYGIRVAYENLLDHFKKKNDKEKQLHYVEKLLDIDKQLYKYRGHIIKEVVKQYETSELISDKEKIVKDLNQKKGQLYRMLFLVSLLIFIIAFLINKYFKIRRTYKKRFQKLIESSIENTSHIKVKDLKQSSENIHQNIQNDILSKLSKFEREKGFLDPKISLNTLSKSLGTNSNYLSKIVNQNLNKNFTTYMNELRINYAVETIINNPKIRLYSIKGMATNFGFNNEQSFSKAFYKSTGIYPSYFIKNLNNLNNEKQKKIL